MTLVAKRREDYRAPEFTITDIALDFTLDPTATRVVSETKVTRQGAADAPLELDGEHMQLLEVVVDDLPFGDYQQTDTGLVLNNVPDAFTLRIVTQVNPSEKWWRE